MYTLFFQGPVTVNWVYLPNRLHVFQHGFHMLVFENMVHTVIIIQPSGKLLGCHQGILMFLIQCSRIQNYTVLAVLFCSCLNINIRVHVHAVPHYIWSDWSQSQYFHFWFCVCDLLTFSSESTQWHCYICIVRAPKLKFDSWHGLFLKSTEDMKSSDNWHSNFFTADGTVIMCAAKISIF